MKYGTDVSSMKRKSRSPVASDAPEYLSLNMRRAHELRYGENPNQPGAIYAANQFAGDFSLELVKGGKGGWSATNFMDAARAADILKFFEKPAVAVMKHLIPSGVAQARPNDALGTVYARARDADRRSAFGSIVATNVPLTVDAAEAVLETYVEGIAAPSFEPGVIGLLEQKKDLRAIQITGIDTLPRYIGDDVRDSRDVRTLPGGFALVQQPYLTSIKGTASLILDPMVIVDGIPHTITKQPSQQQIEDMLMAWYVNIGTRSNGIVLVKDSVTLGVGSGKQERVRALADALRTAYQKEMDRHSLLFDEVTGAIPAELVAQRPFQGAALSSDAFFPFRDAIDMAAAHGIEAIIQPFGSVRDVDVIDAANEHNIAMAATLERCFGHF